MNKPVMMQDAKRVRIYSYGSNGKITITKRFLDNLGDDVDLVEAIENGDIVIENSSDAEELINILGTDVDANAFEAIDVILEDN